MNNANIYTAYKDLTVLMVLNENFSYVDMEKHYFDSFNDKGYKLGERIQSDEGVEAFIFNTTEFLKDFENSVAVKAIIPKGTKYKFSWNLQRVKAENLILTKETYRFDKARKIVNFEDDILPKICKPILRSINKDIICPGYLYTVDKKFVHPAYMKKGTKVLGIVTDVTENMAHIASVDVFYYDDTEFYGKDKEQYHEDIEYDIMTYGDGSWREPTYNEMKTMFEKNREAVCLAYMIATYDTLYKSLFYTGDWKPYMAEGFCQHPSYNDWPTAAIPFKNVKIKEQ